MAQTFAQPAEDYARIEQAIKFLEENFQQQPTLSEVAASVGLSEYHFQRLFSRWAGISPKRFLQFLTVEYAKQRLQQSQSVLDAAYDAGLSSPSRLHDLFVTCEAMTPGEYKKQAEGLTIRYGFHSSPFGECLLALTDRGVCSLDFVLGSRPEALQALRRKWPLGQMVQDQTATEPFVSQIFNPVNRRQALPLVLKGTNFQIKVWHALLRIPPGEVASYKEIAAHIGQPTAARAVGSAVAKNPIGYVIPCHRVIRKLGQIGEYRWGSPRKKAILGWEASHTLATAD